MCFARFVSFRSAWFWFCVASRAASDARFFFLSFACLILFLLFFYFFSYFILLFGMNLVWTVRMLMLLLPCMFLSRSDCGCGKWNINNTNVWRTCAQRTPTVSWYCSLASAQAHSAGYIAGCASLLISLAAESVARRMWKCVGIISLANEACHFPR